MELPCRTVLDPPAVWGCETSQAAARTIVGQARTQRARVLAFLVAQGAEGATDEEIASALGLRLHSETPRRGELVKLGMVRDSGRRRRTSSGRWAMVWVRNVIGAGA